MKLLLVDLKPELCEQWRLAFKGSPEVNLYNGALQSVLGAFDCLVCPGNAFGLLDSGLGATLVDLFGASLQERVQQGVWQHFRGEQPVGTCLLVPTGDARCPRLAHCPTMAQPTDVSTSRNAYAALLAALLTAEAAGVQTLACPGLCTQTGRMPHEVAARQMRFAWEMWQTPFQAPTWASVALRLRQAAGEPELQPVGEADRLFESRRRVLPTRTTLRDAPLQYTIFPGTRPGTTILTLIGPLTLGNLFGFQEVFRTLEAEALILDLSELSYMDSAGLGLLMNGYVSAEHRGQRFLLAHVSDRVAALLQLTRVDQVLPSFSTVEAAEASF